MSLAHYALISPAILYTDVRPLDVLIFIESVACDPYEM